MGNYLNSSNNKFLSYYNDDIFVDKSSLLEITSNNMNKEGKKFMCVTRPRRFGKTLTLSMLNAYYSKGSDSKKMFDKLKISSSSTYLEHLNKHNVISVDMAEIYYESKENFLNDLTSSIISELDKEFPNILTNKEDKIGKAIRQINLITNERFIFLIDEWDVIFREKVNSNLCNEYLDLLNTLFKGSKSSEAIELVYMTGILPIKIYVTESTLNMFEEYNMIKPQNLAEYIGFTENEVKDLCLTHNINFNEMKKWYDGYHLGNYEIYNPRSVVKAITSNEFDDYWNKTGAIEAVTNYMNYDNGILKDKFTYMLGGGKLEINTKSFKNDAFNIDSPDAALTILIHLGYLAYDKTNNVCYIPNYEISQEFVQGTFDLKWNDSYTPIVNSKELYENTIKGNTDFINKTLDINHKDLASLFNKNKEDVLGVIVYLSYYYASKFYFIRKEDTCTTGRADLTFTPRDNTHIPLIIELKADKSVKDAINQIKEKEYYNVFKGYKGKVLLLGITYDSSTLKHESKIEYIEL